MTDFSDSSKPTEPRRTAAISSGQFESGSVFRLVREIRGSAYSVGDQFMLIESEDCHNPNVLKLGGVGENYFIDPRGAALRIEAGDEQIDGIFELVQDTPKLVVEEGQEVVPPTKHITEGEFRKFREGLAGVLHEISQVRSSGERGDRGSRGFTGVQGDKGDKGDQGEKGDTGEKGERGDTGLQGPQGEKGDTGETGSAGIQGEPGIQGERGERGERGEKGERGENGKDGNSGERGAAGDKGETGERGEKGERGERGAAGADGRDGAAGPRGERGEAGERGADGAVGAAGPKGAKGDKGDKGDTGESGVVTAKFPLVYDAAEKTISIDEKRLDKILKKILGGGKVSPQDMGWLASTGGGGKVAVYHNGVKITPDVRGINFTGSGVASVTKENGVGGKLIVNIQGGGGSGVTGPTGPAGATGAGGALGYWGSFWDTGKKTVASTTTAYGITFNNSDPQNNGVTVVDGSKITFQSTGVYNLQFSAQVFNTENNQEHEATFWLKKNGNNIPDTAGIITVTGKHSGITGAALPSWNWMLPLNANDYVELYWHTNSTNVLLDTLPEGTSPVHSVSPAVIFTAQQVMYTQVGPTGPTGPTGATPTDYVSSANGLTGAVTFRGGRGITHSVSGNGISFSVNFLRGGQTFIYNNIIAPSDILLLQTASGVTMYTATVNDVITSNIQIPVTEYTDPTPPSYKFIQQNNGTFYDVDYDLVRSGLIATIDGGTYA